jgi:hypothetical protein
MPHLVRPLLLVAALALAAPMAEAQTALVVVVENNDEVRRGGADRFLRALDRFGEPLYGALVERAARPYWDRVVVLMDEEATFERFAGTLRGLDAAGFTVDVVLDIHGSSTETRLGNATARGPDRLWFQGKPATTEDVAALGRPRKLRLNAVYMVSCWGSRFNDAWLAAGARAANGADELNYYVLLSPLVFIREFGAGVDLQTAAERAYRAEASVLDNGVIDRALAPRYGAKGVERVQTARSSARVHTGPRVRAARFAEREGRDRDGRSEPRALTLF